jgi:hypothetical protein
MMAALKAAKAAVMTERGSQLGASAGNLCVGLDSFI